MSIARTLEITTMKGQINLHTLVQMYECCDGPVNKKGVGSCKDERLKEQGY